MTRVATGAALIGILQGVVVVLLLGPLGLARLTGGWISYAGTYSSSVALTTTPTLPPLLAVPLVSAVVAALAAVLAQRSGWLGPRPAGGAVVPARLGVAAVFLAVAGHALARRTGTTVAFGRAGESGLPAGSAGFVPSDRSEGLGTVVGVAVAAAVVLVVLAALRERRAWARRAVVGVLVVAVGSLVVAVTLLDGLAVEAFAADVVALLLGVAALGSLRRTGPGPTS